MNYSHGQSLSQNPLQAYYAIPCGKTMPSRDYNTDFSFFMFYNKFDKVNEEHKLEIKCECNGMR